MMLNIESHSAQLVEKKRKNDRENTNEKNNKNTAEWREKEREREVEREKKALHIFNTQRIKWEKEDAEGEAIQNIIIKLDMLCVVVSVVVRPFFWARSVCDSFEYESKSGSTSKRYGVIGVFRWNFSQVAYAFFFSFFPLIWCVSFCLCESLLLALWRSETGDRMVWSQLIASKLLIDWYDRCNERGNIMFNICNNFVKSCCFLLCLTCSNGSILFDKQRSNRWWERENITAELNKQ